MRRRAVGLEDFNYSTRQSVPRGRMHAEQRSELTPNNDIQNQDNKAEHTSTSTVLHIGVHSADGVTQRGGEGEGREAELEEGEHEHGGGLSSV